MTLTAHVVAPPRQTTRRAPRPRGRLAPYVFISPALVCLLAFGVLPIIVAGVVSFTNMDIAGLADYAKVHFIGLRNYQKLFADGAFWEALRNTAFLAEYPDATEQ